MARRAMDRKIDRVIVKDRCWLWNADAYAWTVGEAVKKDELLAGTLGRGEPYIDFKQDGNSAHWFAATTVRYTNAHFESGEVVGPLLQQTHRWVEAQGSLSDSNQAPETWPETGTRQTTISSFKLPPRGSQWAQTQQLVKLSVQAQLSVSVVQGIAVHKISFEGSSQLGGQSIESGATLQTAVAVCLAAKRGASVLCTRPATHASAHPRTPVSGVRTLSAHRIHDCRSYSAASPTSCFPRSCHAGGLAEALSEE